MTQSGSSIVGISYTWLSDAALAIPVTAAVAEATHVNALG
jgi:hypothetical protein